MLYPSVESMKLSESNNKISEINNLNKTPEIKIKTLNQKIKLKFNI